MSEEPRVPGNWVGLVLVLVAAINGLISLPGPLTSSRPAEKETPAEANADDTPTARLWEDPFGAVARHRKQQAANIPVRKNEGTSRLEEILGQPKLDEPHADDRNRLLVLPVMVTASPYSDAVEWRVRTRVAVVSALAAASYTPADAEHVYCVDPRVENGEEPLCGFLLPRPPARPPDGRRLPIPCELFEFSGSAAAISKDEGCQFRRVLVVWWAEHGDTKRPLEELLGGIKRFIEAFPDEGACVLRAADYRVIGPWSSATLKAMCSELKGGTKCGGCFAKYDAPAFYSATATADDDVVARSAKVGELPRDHVKALFHGRSLTFRNLTCTDSQLAAELIDGLTLRGVDPRSDRVALIAEHDTLYARSMPTSFERVLTRGERGDLASLGAPNRNVRCFTYLRGLDGKTALDGGSPTEKGRPSRASGREKAASAEEFEHAHGNSQLDYVPRLAKEVQQWASSPGAKLKAIGVLGSDVYDKLLLLQALRRHFPGTLFFTTDLDARLSHPQELPWARNLIVASSYGLQLNDEIQRGIPPFRDSYQTAIFRAVLEAVEDPRSLEKKRNHVAAPPARRFEIGRHGPYDLSVTKGCKLEKTNACDECASNNCDLTAKATTIHPPRASADWCVVLWDVGWATGIFAFLVLAIWQLAPFHRPFWCRLLAHRRWVLVVLAAVVVYVGVIVYSHHDVEGEPFCLSESLSIWPAEILRLAVAVLGGYLVFHS